MDMPIVSLHRKAHVTFAGAANSVEVTDLTIFEGGILFTSYGTRSWAFAHAVDGIELVEGPPEPF